MQRQMLPQEGKKLPWVTIATLVTFSIGGVIAVGYYDENYRKQRRIIEAYETANTITFQTPNGCIKYEIAPEAQKEWQRLLFYEELRQGRELCQGEIFTLCEKADRLCQENLSGDRELSLEEITNARQEAERNARQH